MKEWINRLLDPDSNPSSASLIAVLSGLMGLIISIIAIAAEDVETINTSIHLSKWLLGLALGGKGLQHVTRNRK